MSTIKVSAKAIIIRDGQLLVTKNADTWGFFYLLPGGSQEHGEPLWATLKRECLEEIGVEVHIERLLYIRDYIGSHHEFKVFDADVHRVEVMFACSIPPGANPSNGVHPDSHQVDVEWLKIAELHHYRIYPQVLVDILQSPDYLESRYLGDVN